MLRFAHRLSPMRHPGRAPTLALTLALSLLAGCATLDGLIGQARVDVLGGAVTVAAPKGYCVGPGEVEEDEDTAVVLIGRCISTGLVTPAVITVAVGRAGSGGVMVAGDAALSAFFATPEGLALLARSGRAEDVRLLDSAVEGDAFVMHLQDAQAGEYWRALIGLNGRLVSISATGTGGLALAPQASQRAVNQTLRAMRRAAGQPEGGHSLPAFLAPQPVAEPPPLPASAAMGAPDRPVP